MKTQAQLSDSELCCDTSEIDAEIDNLRAHRTSIQNKIESLSYDPIITGNWERQVKNIDRDIADLLSRKEAMQNEAARLNNQVNTVCHNCTEGVTLVPVANYFRGGYETYEYDHGTCPCCGGDYLHCANCKAEDLQTEYAKVCKAAHDSPYTQKASSILKQRDLITAAALAGEKEEVLQFKMRRVIEMWKPDTDEADEVPYGLSFNETEV